MRAIWQSRNKQHTLRLDPDSSSDLIKWAFEHLCHTVFLRTREPREGLVPCPAQGGHVIYAIRGNYSPSLHLRVQYSAEENKRHPSPLAPPWPPPKTWASTWKHPGYSIRPRWYAEGIQSLHPASAGNWKRSQSRVKEAGSRAAWPN